MTDRRGIKKRDVIARSTLSSAVAGNEELFNLCFRGEGVVVLESNVPKNQAIQGGVFMDWRDFNGDGRVDNAEEIIGAEMLCSSKEEHIALFGDAGDWEDDDWEDDDDDDWDIEDGGWDAGDDDDEWGE